VLGNLTEKMDKCPAVELGVPWYPPKEKNLWDDKNMIKENDSPWSL
jgi:hypothetical protein